VVALAENLTWGIDFILYNNVGRVNEPANIIGALFTSFKSILLSSSSYSLSLLFLLLLSFYSFSLSLFHPLPNSFQYNVPLSRPSEFFFLSSTSSFLSVFLPLFFLLLLSFALSFL